MIAATAVLFAILSPPAYAQEYLFSVPELRMQATVNTDASVSIAYNIKFANSPSGHPIDIVDIGTPHAGYRLNDIRAWIGDRQLRNIRPSTVVKPGFEVHLEGGTIGPGQSGELRVEFAMPEMVYQDTTRKDYASLKITPTWFGSQYVQGTTQILVMIQLPKTVQPDEALHQGLNFTQKAATNNGAVVGWDFPNARLTEAHNVAVSFPKRDMQRVVVMSNIGLLLKWFRESPQARITLGVIFLAMFAFLFFRFSGGTGFSVYVILSAGACILFAVSPGSHLLAMPAVVMLIGLNEWFRGSRQFHYMPPIAQVEGGGIKRGLTAPEAAVLLELPVAKVLSLVIFGMLKKGVLRQLQADPLVVEVDEAFQLKPEPLLTNEDQRAKFYNEAAVKKGVVVQSYEHPFLFLLQSNPGKPAREINFGLPLKLLIQSAAARMKGFDLSETKDYYRSIISRAAEQAKAIGDIPQREQTIDRNFEWILMDPGYPTVFTYGRPYQPMWTRGSTVSLPSGPAPTPSMPGTTSFGDVASGFAGWAENTMGGMASALSPGSLNLPHSSGGGFLDLSGADHVAGEFFQALAKSATSGGGGGGGGCACACAGCACACACAGGGR